jgi:hypothetical protein
MARHLDGDFQNYWRLRRCGKSIGFWRVDCPACGYYPQSRPGEDYFKYTNRRYRAVLSHMLERHLKQKALTYRRIEAEQKRREDKSHAA